MNRTGLIIALVIAAVNGLVFGLFPDLELRVAQHFHDVTVANGSTCKGNVQLSQCVLKSQIRHQRPGHAGHSASAQTTAQDSK